MKTIGLAALIVLTLGTGAAFAQGAYPGAQPQVYGSQAFADQLYHTGTVFSKLFGHRPNTETQASHSTVKNTTPEKGG